MTREGRCGNITKLSGAAARGARPKKGGKKISEKGLTKRTESDIVNKLPRGRTALEGRAQDLEN